MAKQRIVSTSFWDDSYIISLSPTEKLLFLYLITNPLTNIAGVYEVSDQRIVFDTGLKPKIVYDTLSKFTKDKKLIRKGSYIILFNSIKHQNLNPKIITGIEREINNLPPEIKAMIDYDRLSHLTKLNLTKPNLTKPNSTPQAIEYRHLVKESPYQSYELFLKEAQEDSELNAINPDLQFYHSYWVSACTASNKTAVDWFQEIKRYIIQQSRTDNFKKAKGNVVEWKN